MMHFIIFVSFSFVCVSSVLCQNESINFTDVTSTSDTKTSVPFVSSSSTVPNNKTCDEYNGDCKLCVNNKEVQCYYCQENDKCHTFTVETLIPDNQCPLKHRNIGTCKVNLMVLMILGGVAAGIVVIGIVICCCCCCCKRGGRIKLSKDDLKWARQREERKMRAEEKRQERAARTEEIRRKYGLFKDDSPYQRFDA